MHYLKSMNVDGSRNIQAPQDVQHHQYVASEAAQQGQRAGQAVTYNPQLARDQLSQEASNIADMAEEITVVGSEKEAKKQALKDRKLGKDKQPVIMEVTQVQQSEMMPDIKDPETLKKLLATLRNMKQATPDEVLAFVEREFREGDELNEDEQHMFLAYAQKVFESEGEGSQKIAELTQAAKESLETKAGPKIYKGYQAIGVSKEAEALGWGDAKGFKREYMQAVDRAEGPGELLMMILKENSPQEAGRKLALFGQAAQTEVAGMGHLFKSNTETAAKLKAMGDLRILSQSAQKMQDLLDNTRRQAALGGVNLGELRFMSTTR